MKASAGSAERLFEEFFAVGRDVEKAAGQGHGDLPLASSMAVQLFRGRHSSAARGVASLVTPAATSASIAAGA